MVIILFIVAFSAISSAGATDFNSTEDKMDFSQENAIREINNPTFVDLNQSISKNSTVNLDADYEYDSQIDSELYEGITIDRDLTINANNHVITSKGARAFIIAEGYNVIINDLKIVSNKNNSFYCGGSIYNLGDLTLNNCTIVNSSASVYAGAIYNGGTLKISNSQFSDNSIDVVNKSLYGCGGAVYNSNVLTIEDSWFTINEADFGGAIATSKSSTLSNVFFMQNKANYYGGAIYNYPNSSCSVKNSILRYNTAYAGGALYDCNSSSCSFSSNVAEIGNNMVGGNAYTLAKSAKSNDYVNISAVVDAGKPKITITQTGSHKGDKWISVKLVDGDGEPLMDRSIAIYIYKSGNLKKVYKYDYLWSDENGKDSLRLNLPVGNYVVKAVWEDDKSIFTTLNNVKISKKAVILKTKKLTTTYYSFDYFEVKVIDSNKKIVKGAKLKLKIYTGKKYKTVTVTSDFEGIARYDTGLMSAGVHKVVISVGGGFSAKTVTSYIIMKPEKLKITTKTNNWYDSSQLGVCIHLNKNLRFNNLKVQLKVFTGNKYKTYNVVTGYSKIYKSKGICGIQTNKFSAGIHKVLITIKSPNFIGSAIAFINIAKSAKSYQPFTYLITNGNGRYVK
ncbi:MAG: hypothetical protein Q4Q55_03535 [Methanobrevibacter sp.]|nr:hypothetical protein [Methanobrevibacter sp.]